MHRPIRIRFAAHCFALFGALLLSMWQSLAAAATVDGLYEGIARVADTSEASREKAYVDALSVVLIKLSGRRDAPAKAGAALKAAAKYVQRYSYDAGGRIQVGFDNAAVNALLEQVGLPLWGRERPTLLVVYPVALQGLREAQAITELSARQRGVPIMWASETSEAFPATALNQIQMLAQRYNADAVVLARGASAASLNWQVVFNGASQESMGAADEGPQLAADVLASYYAINAKDSGTLTLEVSGIDSVDAYGATLNFLTRQLLVRTVSVDSLNKDVVRFTLELRGAQQALQRALLLDKTLAPVDGADNNGPLKYRYTRSTTN